jgi:hypothetical protein
MRGGRSILDPANVQDRAREVDLLPPEIDHLPSAQPVPEGEEDHERVPLAPAIALRGLDQLLDFRQGKVFSRSKVRSWAGAAGLFELQWLASAPRGSVSLDFLHRFG